MESFIPWIGGKKLLRKKIIEQFPDKIERYVEVFGGAGWVLFAKDRHANLEVWNDVEGDLVNLFRCVKYHAEELQRELQFMLNSRELFQNSLSQMNSKGLTDIQRAARYFTIIKTSYGADRRTYGGIKKDIRRFREYLSKIETRLRNVVIQNKDFENLIQQYDKANTLFYLDPPYHMTEKYYDATFTKEDHQRLQQVLESIKGKFILSYNDDEYIRNLYQKYDILEVERNSNLKSRYKDQEQRYHELIIKNF